MSKDQKGDIHAVELETERLRLRMLDQSYLEDLKNMLSDPLVTRHYPKLPDQDAAQRWIDYTVKDCYAKHGFGFWAVELKESGEFLGVCGLLPQTVEEEEYVEVAYHFKSQHWHKGYATEAARASKEYAFEKLGSDYVVSLIRPINTESQAVAKRNGMVVWKMASYRGFEVLVYRVNADGSAVASNNT